MTEEELTGADPVKCPACGHVMGQRSVIKREKVAPPNGLKFGPCAQCGELLTPVDGDVYGGARLATDEEKNSLIAFDPVMALMLMIQCGRIKAKFRAIRERN